MFVKNILVVLIALTSASFGKILVEQAFSSGYPTNHTISNDNGETLLFHNFNILLDVLVDNNSRCFTMRWFNMPKGFVSLQYWNWKWEPTWQGGPKK